MKAISKKTGEIVNLNGLSEIQQGNNTVYTDFADKRIDKKEIEFFYTREELEIENKRQEIAIAAMTGVIAAMGHLDVSSNVKLAIDYANEMAMQLGLTND